jgi:predicted lipid carrier protein YhbT
MPRRPDQVSWPGCAEDLKLPLPNPATVVPLLAGPLRLVPHPVQQLPLGLALEHLFRASVAEGLLDFLADRCLAVELADAGWRWPVTLRDGRLQVLQRDQPADVTIRGQSWDFFLMAAGLEDPDTLFFQRRLVIQGDTELGLGVKNFLDGLDEAQLPVPAQAGLRVLRGLRSRLGAPR